MDLYAEGFIKAYILITGELPPWELVVKMIEETFEESPPYSIKYYYDSLKSSNT